MKRFSVIIPTWNRAHLIEETLRSVLAQEVTDHEIIVVDAGSTDHTPAVLARFGDRITVVHTGRTGPGAARNAGIAVASGRYITFLDSDDLWFPWSLAAYARAIEAHHEPSFLAGTHVDFSDTPPPMSSPGEFQAAWHPDYLAAAAPGGLWIGTCAAAIRADVLRAVGGFAPADIHSEDSDLWLRLGAASGFVHLTSPTIFAYRRHPASAVSDLHRAFLGARHLVAQERSGAYPGGPQRHRERTQIITRHTRPATLALFRAGRWREGWTLYLSTARWNLALRRFRFLAATPLIAVPHGLLSLFPGRAISPAARAAS